MKKLTHINEKDHPVMVDVGDKKITQREAMARAIIRLPEKTMLLLKENQENLKKGPVFQTAILAGIMGLKNTSQVIPLCHPLPIQGCTIDINYKDERELEIYCRVKTEGKTGVEMEALVGASTAALTIYDMCKAISQDMIIKEIKLLEKKGGKSDINLSK